MSQAGRELNPHVFAVVCLCAGASIHSQERASPTDPSVIRPNVIIIQSSDLG
jgi:hypothetical protein